MLTSEKAGQAMKQDNFASMSVDELWSLREKTGQILTARIEAEKRQLQERLDKLGPRLAPPAAEARERRPYPKVLPKFQNPGRPTQTWAGRGKQPRWVSNMLEAGRSIDDLRIPETA
jgi:DNA-binding protein H-NS